VIDVYEVWVELVQSYSVLANLVPVEIHLRNHSQLQKEQHYQVDWV